MTQDAYPQRDDPEVICPMGSWGFRAIVEEPAAGQLSEQVLSALVDGAEIGPVLLEFRHSLLVEHNSPVGFAYRLLALSDTKVTVGGVVAAIDAEVAS
jgi:hypothetical protein